MHKLVKTKKLKINGLINKPRWKNIKCSCIKNDIEHSYPLEDCKHCKFQECEDSIPRNCFKINEYDNKGKKTVREVQEITIVRGKTNEDIIGWTF